MRGFCLLLCVGRGGDLGRLLDQQRAQRLALVKIWEENVAVVVECQGCVGPQIKCARPSSLAPTCSIVLDHWGLYRRTQAQSDMLWAVQKMPIADPWGVIS
jgi:hypothetical protein